MNGRIANSSLARSTRSRKDHQSLKRIERQWLIEAAVTQWKWAFDQPAYSWNYAYGGGGEVRVVGVALGAPTMVSDPVPRRPPSW